MADYLTVRRTPDHRYLVPIHVAGYEVEAEVDTAFTQPECMIGLGLERDIYRAIRNSLTDIKAVPNFLVGGQIQRVECGVTTVSIIGLDNSEVETYVAEVGDNLLGVCYLHRLVGHEIIWDLEAGEMMIRKKTREAPNHAAQ